jgi:hypothetical protein
LLKHSLTQYNKKYTARENKICPLEPNDETLNILLNDQVFDRGFASKKIWNQTDLIIT